MREAAIVEELAQHLDDCYAELLATSLSGKLGDSLVFLANFLLAAGLANVARVSVGLASQSQTAKR